MGKICKKKRWTSPGGLEPPTFRLTAERANRLRHGDIIRERDEERDWEDVVEIYRKYSRVHPTGSVAGGAK